MDKNYIIETKNLTKQYGSQKSVADLNEPIFVAPRIRPSEHKTLILLVESLHFSAT